jgi:EAL domain-containing protein (putative c-di-GMP-specific phosphodiesterase class I)
MDQVKPVSATESPLVDFEAMCQKIRAAIDSVRIYAISLLDEKGDVLWMTEGSMGPDEHNAVVEAFEAFANVKGPVVHDYDLGDSRSAVLFRIVNTRRAMAGAVMVVTDTRGITQDDKGAARLMTPKLQRALSEFAATRTHVGSPPAPKATSPKTPPAANPPAAAKAISAVAPATPVPAAAADSVLDFPELTLADEAPPTAAAPAPVQAPSARASAKAAPAPAASATAASAPTASATVASPAPAPPPQGSTPDKRATAAAPAGAVSPDIDRLHAALRRSPIALHVQRLVPLNKGTQLRRYEVLLRSSSEDAPNTAPQAMLKAAVENGLGSMIDRRVITQLIGWLVHHPDVWEKKAVMFSVNLTNTALHDEHFIKFIELCLTKASLPKAMIAFEVDVSTALNYGGQVAEIATALHRLGCPLVLDDFGLRTECFDLLRLPSVRYIKLASEITAKMRSDKLSQAAITGVVQMARVMGMHTVAKRTETAAEQEWLTALGVDFIQSHALSPPVTIESLTKTPAKA